MTDELTEKPLVYLRSTYLMDDLKIPANRLAANGFGEFQPIDDRDTPEAYKTNRRIELKFTER